jgi:bifunctional DNA-binding transcriptional regulator/antitoxin component of YhaV-PrlF toxin-antitoxin module
MVVLMSGTTSLDDRGRITIDRELRARLGKRVVQVLTPHGVLLRPVPDTLQQKGRRPRAASASGESAAAKEAGR